MKLKEIITEGVVGDFIQGAKSGYSSADQLTKTSPKSLANKLKKQFSEPKQRTALDSVNRRELKNIIRDVLDGKSLESSQQQLLKTFLDNL